MWSSADSDPQGVGVDPVFQLYSHLWDADLVGDEGQFYNLTMVNISP